MTKRFRRFIAAFLAAMMLLTTMTVTTLAASDSEEKVIFSLNAVSETDTTFVLSVKFERGAFSALDFGVVHNSSKVVRCTDIKTVEGNGFLCVSNEESGLVSMAVPTGWSDTKIVLATYTYEKVSGARIDKNDFSLVIDSCTSYENEALEAEVQNNLFSINTAFGYCGDDASWILYDNGVMQISGTGSMYNYSSDAPAPWSDYRSQIRKVKIDGVTNVGNDTFVGCNNLKEVVLSDSITKIGNTAFRDCVSLEKIDIPATVKTIGYYAFYGCTALSSIDIPEGVQTIGNHAFRKCTGLKSVTVPLSLREVAANAFEGCTSLDAALYKGTVEQWAEVSVANGNEPLTDNLIFALYNGECGNGVVWSVTAENELIISGVGEMADYANAKDVPWNQYKKDIVSITVCDGVKYIGNNAFNGCVNARKLSIPASARQYNGPYVYSGCTNITEIIITKDDGVMCDFGTDSTAGATKTYYKYAPWYVLGCPKVVLEEGITAIGAYAFAYNATLKEIAFPSTLKKIGANAFYNCTRIEEIRLPDGIKEIGNYAFYGCAQLKSFIIPLSVESIGKAAFRYCDSLDVVFFNGTAYEWSLVGYNDWPSKTIVAFMVQHGDANDTFTILSYIPVTCTKDGKKVYYCRCGSDIITEVTPALGHSFNEWVIGKEPTCTESGHKTHTCTVCKFSETVTIPALGMVHSVSLPDRVVNYKTTVNLAPNIKVDKNVDYVVTYSSSDTSVAEVDANGNLNAKANGNVTITCTVTDEYGNTVKDTCNVTVEYAFWQWLIVIVLFGWAWY